jgi:protein-S-isoprenylcysteine O-methyltransferase Ste14
MRLFWLAALGAVTVLMGVLTPYVFRTQPTWWAVGWSVMLVCAVGATALLAVVERRLRSMNRSNREDVPEA